MTELLERITVNPEQCGGRPCIRGMRIRVVDILDLFAAGLTTEQILVELPDLELEDVKAALEYAARRPLFSKLREISIDGPEDFSENLDFYLTGEKTIG